MKKIVIDSSDSVREIRAVRRPAPRMAKAIDRKEMARRELDFQNINLRDRRNSQNFKKNSNNPNQKLKKKFWRFKNIALLVILLIVLAGGVYAYKTFFIAGQAFNLNPITFFANQITGKTPTLNSTNGRVNVLIVGVDNRGENLTQNLSTVGNTDTIMIASLDTKTSNVEFISVPRDLVVKFALSDGSESAKINAGVALGTSGKYSGGGAQLLRDTLETLTGLKINYTIIINFEAFTQVIDALGGIDVNVENSFCDAEYPLAGDKGTEVIKFTRGEQHMDGTTALKFARSRVHATCANFTAGDPVFEGTDFRRAYRQQQVVRAVQEKISKMGIDITKIQSILEALGNNILTEMGDGALSNSNKIDLDTLKAVYDIKDKIKSSNEYSFVVNPDSCGGKVLKEGTTELGYSIYPALSNGFSLLKDCITSYLNAPAVFQEVAGIAIYNNTGYTVANASNLANDINKNWLDATYYGSVQLKTLTGLPETDTTDPTHGNYVIDIHGDSPATIEFLAKKYNAAVLKKENLPKSLQSINIDVMFISGPAPAAPQ